MLQSHAIQICLVFNKRRFLRVQIFRPGVKKGSHDYQIKREQRNGSIRRPSVFLDHSSTRGFLQEKALSNRKVKKILMS